MRKSPSPQTTYLLLQQKGSLLPLSHITLGIFLYYNIYHIYSKCVCLPCYPGSSLNSDQILYILSLSSVSSKNLAQSLVINRHWYLLLKSMTGHCLSKSNYLNFQSFKILICSSCSFNKDLSQAMLSFTQRYDLYVLKVQPFTNAALYFNKIFIKYWNKWNKMLLWDKLLMFSILPVERLKL